MISSGLGDVSKTPKAPAPKDPGLENADALMAKKLTAFQGQDHQAHIDAHRTFMSTLMIRNNPHAHAHAHTHRCGRAS